jgi:hypothetical protein
MNMIHNDPYLASPHLHKVMDCWRGVFLLLQGESRAQQHIFQVRLYDSLEQTRDYLEYIRPMLLARPDLQDCVQAVVAALHQLDDALAACRNGEFPKNAAGQALSALCAQLVHLDL